MALSLVTHTGAKSSPTQGPLHLTHAGHLHTQACARPPHIHTFPIQNVKLIRLCPKGLAGPRAVKSRGSPCTALQLDREPFPFGS